MASLAGQFPCSGDLAKSPAKTRLGNVGALVRAARSSERSERIGENAAALARPALNRAAINLSVQRKRQLVAMFCRMLGDQLSDGPVPLAPLQGPPLSPRQRQTLDLLLSGNAEKEIATRLRISRHTVHVYVKSLYKRFNVCSRGELLAQWVHRSN